MINEHTLKQRLSRQAKVAQTSVKFTTKGECLLYFDSNQPLVFQVFLPAKDVVEHFSNRPCFSLAIKTTTKQQPLHKQRTLRCMNNEFLLYSAQKLQDVSRNVSSRF